MPFPLNNKKIISILLISILFISILGFYFVYFANLGLSKTNVKTINFITQVCTSACLYIKNSNISKNISISPREDLFYMLSYQIPRQISSEWGCFIISNNTEVNMYFKEWISKKNKFVLLSKNCTPIGFYWEGITNKVYYFNISKTS